MATTLSKKNKKAPRPISGGVPAVDSPAVKHWIGRELADAPTLSPERWARVSAILGAKSREA